MIIPEHFKKIPYVEGGRDFWGADCYGVLRLWLQYRQIVDLPAWGNVISKRRAACAEAYAKSASGFVSVNEARQDDVITCHNRAGDLEHIGAIIETSTGLSVYHSTATSRRPVVTPLNAFKRHYKNTELIRYANSESIYS